MVKLRGDNSPSVVAISARRPRRHPQRGNEKVQGPDRRKTGQQGIQGRRQPDNHTTMLQESGKTRDQWATPGLQAQNPSPAASPMRATSQGNGSELFGEPAHLGA